MTFELEADLVRLFADSVHRFPIEALSPGATRLLIIGHETRLPEAGKGGGGGSVDLLAVDDRGELWVIEAKLSRNAECVPLYVFANQLLRYASALRQVEFSTLHGHLQDFAFGRRGIRPPEYLASRWLCARSLEEMLGAWLEIHGMDAADTEAAELV